MKIPGILWVIACVIFLRLKTRTVDFVLFIFLFLGECGSQVFRTMHSELKGSRV